MYVQAAAFDNLQHGGGWRYTVGYPVQLQEHATHRGHEALTLGRALGRRGEHVARDQHGQRQRQRYGHRPRASG